MDQQKHDTNAAEPNLTKKVYSSPRITDFGSVETLSLSGTVTNGENPGAHAKNKAP